MAENDDKNPKVVPFRRRKAPGSGKYLSVQRELNQNPLTKGLVAYDSFSRTPMLMRPIPLPDARLDADFRPRPLEDGDFVGLLMHLEARGFEKLTPGVIRDVLAVELQQHRFSPPADLLSGLGWDGEPRLDDFFLIYAGVEIEGESEEDRRAHRAFVQRVTRCFFISVVARVLRPGCKVDTMLVFEGVQGTLKSSLLRKLALKDEWFSDTMPHNLASKDARQSLPGNLIVELAELSQFRASEIETTKAFLSTQIDKYRPSYGHLDIRWPRQNVFVGTTNADTYLKDTTGNRRFWPIKVNSIDLDGVQAVLMQVYGEAVAAFKAGDRWWLDDDVEMVASKRQAERKATDPWERTVRNYVEMKKGSLDIGGEFYWVSTSEVLDMIGVPLDRQERGHEMRVGAMLREIGGERRKTRHYDGAPQWSYRFAVPTFSRSHSTS